MQFNINFMNFMNSIQNPLQIPSQIYSPHVESMEAQVYLLSRCLEVIIASGIYESGVYQNSPRK